MEVEQNHLSFQIGKMTHHALVVEKSDIQYSSLLNLAGIYLNISILRLYNTLVLHAFDSNIVQVLTTLCMWIIGIPASSNSGKRLDIFFVAAWIKDEIIANSLEQRKICISLIRLLVDVITLNFVLIGIDKSLDTVVSLYNAKFGVTLQCNSLGLQINLLKSQLTDFIAVIRTANGII